MERILGAFASADGRWRVEAVAERGRRWYRILRDGQVHADHLVRAGLDRHLAEAGLELADLSEE
jgi:hypothetical protein